MYVHMPMSQYVPCCSRYHRHRTSRECHQLCYQTSSGYREGILEIPSITERVKKCLHLYSLSKCENPRERVCVLYRLYFCDWNLICSLKPLRNLLVISVSISFNKFASHYPMHFVHVQNDNVHKSMECLFYC